MSSLKERKRLQKIYGSLYRRVKGFDLEKCCYCNSGRQCLDHVPPLSMLPGIDTDEYGNNGGKFLLYPSCLECNRLLTDKIIITFIDRLDYLQDRYNRKLEKSGEVWSEKELEEMGKNLKSYILTHSNKASGWIKKLREVSDNIDDYWTDMDEENF